MRPVSAGFLEALTGSHNMASRLRAVPAGQTGTNPVGGVQLLILDGDVQLDGSADIRATAECTVSATDPVTGEPFWPDGSADVLTPYGAYELFVERGVAFGGGSIEYVPLGYFRINDVEQPDAPDGPIRMTGTDRMSMIIDATLTDPVQYGPTDTFGEVVDGLVLDAYALAEIDWDDLSVAADPIGRSVVVESDRYAFLKELVTSVGKVAYFDHRGRLVIKDIPDPSTPLWTVSRGRSGVLVSAARSISRSGVYNGVIATGEAFDTEPPARGLAVDDNVSSPTYWGGAFGKVPREFASPLLLTDAQAKLAAATVLKRSLGLPYNVDFTAVPNPALEPDDPIAIGIEGTPTIVVPELLAADSFSRTVVNGVGTSDDGHAWSIAAGADANYQVSTGALRKTLAASTSTYILMDAAVGRPDIDLYMDVQVPNLATGASLVAGFALRYNNATDYYSVRVEFDVSDNTVSMKMADHFGVYTEIAAVSDYGLYTAAQWWTVRARAHDETIQLKAWPRDTAPEPTSWGLAYYSATRAVTTNRFGLWWWRVPGNTNASAPQFINDNFRAYAVPERLLRGGELHVMDSLTIPLTADQPMQGKTREQTLIVIGTS